MDLMTYGPFVIGRELDFFHALYFAQRMWDCFPDDDIIELKDDTGFVSRIVKKPAYPCILFEYDPYENHLYKVGMYSNYRGAIKAFSRRASDLRSCHYRADLERKYSDIQFLIWDAENGALLHYRHYYGHNTRLGSDNLRMGVE